MSPRRGHVGVLLLAMEMTRNGFENIPPVALITIAVQVVLFLRLFDLPWWSVSSVCVSADLIIRGRQWRRLALAPLEHFNDMHLLYNMVSFLVKARYLERRFGARRFAVLLVVFSLLTSLTYVSLCHIADFVMVDTNFSRQCCVGFSGVIFALKVLTCHYDPQYQYNIRLFNNTTLSLYWVELILIYVLVPESSFIGHLAGILVGLAYTQGPLKRLLKMDFL